MRFAKEQKEEKKKKKEEDRVLLPFLCAYVCLTEAEGEK